MGRIFILSLVAVCLCAAGSDSGAVPDRSKDLVDVRAWVEATKGFGQPKFFELSAGGKDFFVVTNNPNSGAAITGTYSYVLDGEEWQLFDSRSFRDAPTIDVKVNDAGTGLIYVTWKQVEGPPLVPGGRGLIGFDPATPRVVQEVLISDIAKKLTKN